jgi:hypothetical protein
MLSQLLQTALQRWPGSPLRGRPAVYKPPERRKGSGRKRDGQPGDPGSGPELLPIERLDDVVEHHPQACLRCGTLLQGEDPEPWRHQVIEIPLITPLVIEHRLHRLVCPCCSTRPARRCRRMWRPAMTAPRLSALVGLLGSAFPLSFSKTQALLDQLLGVEYSFGEVFVYLCHESNVLYEH